MRVTIRREWRDADGTSTDCEVDLHADGGYSPDCVKDLVMRAFELWGLAFDTDEATGE